MQQWDIETMWLCDIMQCEITTMRHHAISYVMTSCNIVTSCYIATSCHIDIATKRHYNIMQHCDIKTLQQIMKIIIVMMYKATSRHSNTATLRYVATSCDIMTKRHCNNATKLHCDIMIMRHQDKPTSCNNAINVTKYMTHASIYHS